jgi:hypothetical protein
VQTNALPREGVPFRVLVIQTDNDGAEFQSRFHRHLEAQDVRHVYRLGSTVPGSGCCRQKTAPTHTVVTDEVFASAIADLEAIEPLASVPSLGLSPYRRVFP